MNYLPIDIRIAQERDQSRRTLAGVNKAHSHHEGLPFATQVAMRCNLDDLTDKGRSFLQFWKLHECPPDTLPNRPGIPFEGMPLGQA
jgi:hypothetical protein